MTSFKKLVASAVFSAAALCGTSLVHADPVTFGTYGNFTAGAGIPADVASATTTTLGATSTLGGTNGLLLSFTGETATNINSSPIGTAITLGSFSLTLPTPTNTGSFNGTDSFTLHVTQTNPNAPGGQDVVYDVKGSVSYTGSGDGASVKIEIPANTDFFLAGEEYTIANLVTLNSNNTPNAFQVNLTGTVTGPSAAVSTPLPSSATGGLVLLGLLGLAKFRKAFLFA